MLAKVFLTLLSAALIPTAFAQQPADAGTERTGTDSKSESARDENSSDKEEVATLLRELESTLEQIGEAQVSVTNVRKIVDALDQGAVKATDGELVRTNQYVRKELAREFRALRAKARSVATQVQTVVLPKQRGVGAKLRTRWELETDEAMKAKIATLSGEHEANMTETTDQLERLERNIESLTGAIQIIEKQLSYLDLVEESIGLSRHVAEQLKGLNKEIDKVVAALVEKELGR